MINCQIGSKYMTLLLNGMTTMPQMSNISDFLVCASECVRVYILMWAKQFCNSVFQQQKFNKIWDLIHDMLSYLQLDLYPGYRYFASAFVHFTSAIRVSNWLQTDNFYNLFFNNLLVNPPLMSWRHAMK